MAKRIKYGACALCGREQPLTFHHLIPKKNHKKNWFLKTFTKEDMKERGINVCRPCHYKVHEVHSEKELGAKYNTREKLLEDPAIHKFVQWVQKKR